MNGREERSGHSLTGRLAALYTDIVRQRYVYISSVYVLTTSSLYRATEYRT